MEECRIMGIVAQFQNSPLFFFGVCVLSRKKKSQGAMINNVYSFIEKAQTLRNNEWSFLL